MRCEGPSFQWLLLFPSMGSRAHRTSVAGAPGLWSTGSVVVAHGLSCSVACGIFLDLGLNPRLLHWQADCLPLSHRGSPVPVDFMRVTALSCFFCLICETRLLPVYLFKDVRRIINTLVLFFFFPRFSVAQNPGSIKSCENSWKQVE